MGWTPGFQRRAHAGGRAPGRRVDACRQSQRPGEVRPLLGGTRNGEVTMLYAAEYVFPGHPDKLCDAIADALVEEAVRREKRALCGIEVAVHRLSVFITGRIACRG